MGKPAFKQTAIVSASVILLLASSFVGVALLVEYIDLGFGFDAQWQLPFYFYGIPAELVAGFALLIIAFSGLWRRWLLLAWAISALALPLALQILIRFYEIPIWRR